LQRFYGRQYRVRGLSVQDLLQDRLIRVTLRIAVTGLPVAQERVKLGVRPR